MSDSVDHRWYVLKVVTGREKTVHDAIDSLMQSGRIAEDCIKEVFVPTHSVLRIKNGKKISEKKSLFSGYVLVNMLMERALLGVLRGVSGVLGFVSVDGQPIPLSPSDVKKLTSINEDGGDDVESDVLYDVGQRVKIIDGPFASFVGEIESVDSVKRKVRIAVSIFGRSTPVDLDWSQITLLDPDE